MTLTPFAFSFVTATRVKNSEVAIFRSYENALPETLYEYCTIWEACRATSAAPRFFDPVQIGPYGQEFIDGGILYNNPIHLLHQEALATWSTSVDSAVFVSVGTGNAPNPSFEGNMIDIIKALKEITVQTERTSDDFYLGNPDIVERNCFFRFNVGQGLSDVGLAEYEQKAKVADATQSYLMKAEVQRTLRSCIDRLCATSVNGKFMCMRD
jgi:predicted acylesterase/phospholipase RssA